jgi:hypothetical protein
MKSSILSLFIACAAPLTAGQLVPSQISSEAKWLVHADLDAMRDSETGKAVFDLIEADHGKRLRSLSTFLALQPLNELHGITLYGDGKFEHAAALIDGKFDRQLLEGLVRTTKDYSEITHVGHVIHSWVEEGVKQHVAFASDGLMVFSRQEDGLKQALDALQPQSSSLTNSLAAAETGRPLVVARARISEMELPKDLSRLVRMTKTLQLAAFEADSRFTVRASAETDGGGDADRLRRMLDGVLAFAQTSDAKLEGLDLRAELDAITRSPVFIAVLSLPVSEWISLLRTGMEENDEKKKD